MNRFSPRNLTTKERFTNFFKDTDDQNSFKQLALCPLRQLNLQLKKLPQYKLEVPGGLTGEFYHTFKEETLAITQTVPENRRKGNTSWHIS